MQEFLRQNKNLETKWLRTGEALGAGAKIYGFRVDNVHSDTYKMISTLARNGNDQECEIDLIEEENSGNQDDRNKRTDKKRTTARKKLQMQEGDGEKTLDTDENL